MRWPRCRYCSSGKRGRAGRAWVCIRRRWHPGYCRWGDYRYRHDGTGTIEYDPVLPGNSHAVVEGAVPHQGGWDIMGRARR